jgi:thiopurine S-methyltransferase
MQPDFWHERWRTDQIGFHQPQVAPALQRHWQDLGLDPADRVFVPLCGKSLDLLWLRDRGHAVVGVELSAIALEAFCAENGIAARRRARAGVDLYQAPHLDLFCGDFFALTPAQVGGIAAIYDRAALISWNEELRKPYAQRMAELTPSGAKTLLVTLEYPQSQKAGPPFSIPPAEVARLYGEQHAIQELSRHDILASEPRMRARGITELHEVCYRLTRL